MVEGRQVIYGKFREDKEAKPGYSREIVSSALDPKYYDDMDSIPGTVEGCDTILKHFKRQVTNRRNVPYLGSREITGKDEKGKDTFGEYQWKTYSMVQTLSENIARGMRVLNLSPEVNAEKPGEKIRFLGVWSKNREEWITTLLGTMMVKTVVVGFYDAMGPPAVDYITNQTELSTIAVAAPFVQKCLDMKKAGLMKTLLQVVTFDNNLELAEEYTKAGMRLISMKELQEVGSKASSNDHPLEESQARDNYLFSYTSGTTGDSKGVQLNHHNVLSVVESCALRVPINEESRHISYLPLPHGFEQCLFTMSCILGNKIGFYSGDPLNLIADCALFKPTFFASVPRLFNKIYGKIQENFKNTTGCKRWLVDKACAGKIAGLAANPARANYFNTCYDMLVFNKVRALLGGEVQQMMTGSAPIDVEVMNFLKVAFCAPIYEGYGLTETAGACSMTFAEDPLAGHVGGTLECTKLRLKDIPEMQYLSTDIPNPRGEVQMFGTNITAGYYKRPDKNAEGFEKDGWFTSGDVGVILPNGSLKIIDRAKNIFKLSQGEYIAPEKLENVYINAPLIGQIFVYGDSLKNSLCAVIVPEIPPVMKWAAANGKDSDFKTLCQDPELKKAVSDSIMQLAVAAKFSSLEKPYEIILVPDAFTVENNLITPTFKLKRNIAKQVFQKEIDQMYVNLEKIGR